MIGMGEALDARVRRAIAARLRPVAEAYDVHRAHDPVRPERGDHDLNPLWAESRDRFRTLRAAAVLVPIVERPDGATVLFTQRSSDLPQHAGQVSFPGGRIDPGDAHAVAAALRETEEETGIAPRFVEPVGLLDAYETGTGFSILPIVGFVDPGFELRVNAREVDAVFEVPLAWLMDPANHQRHSAEWRGQRREYYAMPYEGRYIWGATAGIVVGLSQRLRAAAL